VETKHRERSLSDYAPMTPVGAILPMTRLQQWGAIAKSTTSIVGAVSLLAMAMIFLASYRDLPARTKENHDSIATLKGSVDSVKLEMRDVKILLAQSLCMQMSEKRHTDWQSCFIQTGPLSVVAPRTVP
jgi:hypothetical protein